jgi:hypothetical protein
LPWLSLSVEIFRIFQTGGRELLPVVYSGNFWNKVEDNSPKYGVV